MVAFYLQLINFLQIQLENESKNSKNKNKMPKESVSKFEKPKTDSRVIHHLELDFDTGILEHCM